MATFHPKTPQIGTSTTSLPYSKPEIGTQTWECSAQTTFKSSILPGTTSPHPGNGINSAFKASKSLLFSARTSSKTISSTTLPLCLHQHRTVTFQVFGLENGHLEQFGSQIMWVFQFQQKFDPLTQIHFENTELSTVQLQVNFNISSLRGTSVFHLLTITIPLTLILWVKTQPQ